MNVTDSQREALIAAGGCGHVPNPFVACGACPRPAIAGAPNADPVAYGFVAETIDGTVIPQSDAPSVSHLPLDVVRKLVVLTTDPRVPRVTLVVDPEKGERLFRFRRVAKRVRSSTMQMIGSTVVDVFEVRNADGWALRLYLHPIDGPILSTQDIYF